jgi:autotransporter strand-loop-strand O-heptosyltransferase
MTTKFLTLFNKNTAKLKIVGDGSDINNYFVEFVDVSKDVVEYSTFIKVNYWTVLNNIDNKDITIRVYVNDDIVFEKNRNEKYNKVYIIIGSNSLGDNIAWIPYVEEYRTINNVDVLVYSSYGYLFDKAYHNLNFTNISNPDDIYEVDKKFRIDYGPKLYLVNDVIKVDEWYKENIKYDNFVNDIDYRELSLQSIAPLILGLENKEIVSKVNIPNENRRIKGKYVVVAIQSTSQLKYWNNPFGWERLFSFLERNGYKIVLIDKNRSFGVYGNFNIAPKNKSVIDKTGNRPLEDRIIDIKYADMMITISSGLAWLSWAVGTPVVMISGFTKPWNEFKTNCIRVFNDKVCNGCWNDTNIRFDPHNWLFCPRDQNFICSMAIQPKDVIDSIKHLIKK